jgi:hypothetical protein
MTLPIRRESATSASNLFAMIATAFASRRVIFEKHHP